MKAKFLKQSFVGGEIAPEMQGRIDDVGYENGLAVCRNFVVRPQGAVDNRPGFRFVREVKDSSRRVRLLPFSFSAEQTMVLEFGHRYCRFHTGGGTLIGGNGHPYEIETPYEDQHLFDIHYVQSADVLTLVHPDYTPRELRRHGALDWRMVVIAFSPQFPAPSNVQVTAHRAPSAAGVVQINLQYRYKVAAVIDGVEGNASTEVSATNDLYTSGSRNVLTWQAVPGVEQYIVYKFQSGMFGFAGYATVTSFEDSGVTVDMSKTPPLTKALFNSANNYPSAVSYFQQRRIFAGTRNEPQKIWMTRSGTESDMSYSMPSRDDDRIEIRVAAREANHIRHVVPLSQLLIMTGAAEWAVETNNTDVLTAASVGVSPHSYIGASNVQPVIVNASLLYCASRGGHVRELAYSRDAGGFISGDLSLRAPHLFDGHEIVDMAYGKAPYPLVWFMSSNGRLLGNTYVPEQEIGAWHWHDTDGFFESCAVVAEGHEDVLYVVVRRHINGQWRRYVERLETRRFATPEDAFFVDCGLTYSGTPATRVSGLEHLEGKTVNILADGAVHPQRVVQGGSITLQHPASKVQVGLPITADIKTLPVAGEVDNAYGRGRKKNVDQIWLDVLSSSGILAGPAEDALVAVKQRTDEPMGSPPRLKTGQVDVVLMPQWNEYGQVMVRQHDPLPLTIVSLTKGVSIA